MRVMETKELFLISGGDGVPTNPTGDALKTIEETMKQAMDPSPCPGPNPPSPFPSPGSN